MHVHACIHVRFMSLFVSRETRRGIAEKGGRDLKETGNRENESEGPAAGRKRTIWRWGNDRVGQREEGEGQMYERAQGSPLVCVLT